MATAAKEAVADGGSDPVNRLAQRLQRKYGGRITGQLVTPARDARYQAMPDELDARLRSALVERGISQLYSHQRRAWDSIRSGQHTVVVTPTASGKTLCYNLPVLQDALQGGSKALYLFPTKALS
ncbi:MAG: DEAD/DEAH box helicase, partial [Ectothiorhodospiraceae bacterium]